MCLTAMSMYMLLFYNILRTKFTAWLLAVPVTVLRRGSSYPCRSHKYAFWGRTGNLGSHGGRPHCPTWDPSSPLGPRRPAMLLLLLLPWLVSLWAQALVSAMVLGWPRLPGAHTCTEVQANCMVSMLTTTHRAWGPMGLLHSPIGLHWTPLYFTK